jgi:membrane-associated phospholipid phosphatase
MNAEADRPVRVARRAAAIAGTCAVLMALIYLVAVWTPIGQRAEDRVLTAAGRALRDGHGTWATTVLHTVSTPMLLAAAAVVVLVGVLRHRFLLGALGAGVIVASVLTAEVVQRAVLRPVLLDAGYRREDQSFPSGHTAVACSVMCALVLVVPYRWRGPTVLVTSLWAAGVAVAAVAAGWHRPSDIVGSDLIVLAYACAVVLVLARRGQVSPVARRPVGFAAVACGVAVQGAGGSAATDVLAVGQAIALWATVGTVLTLLALVRRVDLGAAPPGPGDG